MKGYGNTYLWLALAARAESATRAAPARTFCLEAADVPCLSDIGTELGRPPGPIGGGRDDVGGAIAFAVED